MPKFDLSARHPNLLKLLIITLSVTGLAVPIFGNVATASVESSEVSPSVEAATQATPAQQAAADLTQSNVPDTPPAAAIGIETHFTSPNDPNNKADSSISDKGIVDLATQDFSKEDILNDRAHRILDTFHAPSTFNKRVAFWFDIYTRYGSNVQLIHDSDHPWIIYSIVDTTSVLALPVKTHNKITPFIRAAKQVKTERANIAKTLRALIKKTNRKNPEFNTEEQRIATLFEDIPGKRKKVFTAALHGIRSQVGQRDFYKSGVINSAKYLSRMEETFARYDLPTELTRIPLVESSFNELAISKAGASGIWQFMPHVGKHFLYMDYAIDERNSPLKATDAAAQLLLQNFRIFKNWPLAITAYNHGSGGVRHAMKTLNTDDLETIVEKYHNRSFQFASSNYYASFLAALYAERYQKEIFGPLPKIEPLASDTINLAYRMKAANIVKVAGMTMEELRLYNPDLKIKGKSGNFFLHKGYALHLPEGRGARIELFHLQAQDYLDKKGNRKKRAALRAESANRQASLNKNE